MSSKLRNYLDRRRAAADAARLFSGELTEQDEVRLAKRRGKSGEYQASLIDTAHLLSDLEKFINDPELLSLVDQKQGTRNQEQGTGAKPLPSWPKLALAASLVLGVFLGATLMIQQPAEKHRLLLYVTRTGEQKTVTLEDNSTLTLNTATQLLVDMSDSSRRVILERGEAYFDIAADPNRPFSVELGNRTVSVLGTAFNIRRSPEKFTLAVIEGTVSLLREGEFASASAPELTLTPGETVRLSSPGQRRFQAGMVAEFDISKQELTAYRETNILKLQRWRDGLISFNADPLSQVVQELNRYSSKKILIEDADIMELQIYATAKINDVESVLIGLEQSLPIKVISYVDRVVIVGKP